MDKWQYTTSTWHRNKLGTLTLISATSGAEVLSIGYQNGHGWDGEHFAPQDVVDEMSDGHGIDYPPIPPKLLALIKEAERIGSDYA